MSGDEQKLNPQIRTIEIGVKDLRSIKIYPMSMADQKVFGKVVQEGFAKYIEKTPEGSSITQDDLMPFVQDLIGITKDNIQEILKIVTDLSGKERENLFNDVTNYQMTEITRVIVEDNFGDPAKNVWSLIEKYKILFPSMRQSPPLSNDTANLDSITSIKEASEMED